MSKRQKTVTLDDAGRIVIPKAIRDSLRLLAGEPLTIEEGSDAIIIRRQEGGIQLKQIDGWWVISGGARADFSITELIDEVRADRVRELGGE